MLLRLPARALLVVSVLAASLVAPSAASAQASSDYEQVVHLTFPVRDPNGLTTFRDDYHDPRGGGTRVHRATDIGGARSYGLSVHAAVGGTVTWITGLDGSAVHASAGWAITIAGDDGRSYSYVHLGRNDGPVGEAYAPGMRRGVRVERGQHIGFLGYSGNASKSWPHLHFEISQPGVEDPYGSERINPVHSLRAAVRRGDLPSGSAARTSGAGFADVPTGHAHETGIAWVAERRITDGCGSGRYCPESGVTRGQMATFIQKAANLPDGGDHGFSDVPAGYAHARGIAAVKAAGIANGVGGGRFDPQAMVSRAQMATFLRNALELPASSRTYRDVPRGSTHAAAIGAIGDAGITTGYADGSYRPDLTVSRAQMATFLKRAFENR